MKSPIVLLVALLDDVKQLHPRVRGIDRDVKSVYHRFEHEGIGFLTNTLSVYSDAFDEGLSTGRFTCPRNFKKVPRGAIPRLFSGMLCEVFDRSTGALLDNADPTVVKSIREVLRLFKKLQPTDEQDRVLDQKARLKFTETELQVKSVLPDRLAYRLRCLGRLVLQNLNEFEGYLISPKHGPGAVVEKYTPNQKWNGVLSSIDRLVDYGFDLFALNIGLGSIGSTPDELFFTTPPRSTARVCSVPKNFSSKRTITVEPCEQQFVQQGLNTVLRDSISRCPVLSLCLSLSDQSKNQVLALEGSRSDTWATIDLSSASDLLSLSVVSEVFGSKSAFLEALCDSRSSYVDSWSQPLRKYAGMGNATTFPVQSVCFALLGISAILGNKRITYRNVRRAARNIRVYGDDIIVKREYAHAVSAEIESAGLIVNRSKSFLEGNFKESCGMDAFRGYDVTPLYVRYLSDDRLHKRAKELAHLVQLSNQAWLRGLYHLSTCIKEDVENRFRSPIPYGPLDAGYLCWHTRQGWATVEKWSRSLHRMLVRAPVVSSPYRRDPIDGYAALLKSFFVPLIGRPKKHLERTSLRHKLIVRGRWVPV